MKGGDNTETKTDLVQYEARVLFHAADDAEVADLMDDVLDVLPANASISVNKTTPSA